MIAQSRASVVPTENATLLQCRYDMIDEQGEVVWKKRWQDVEAVAAAVVQPLRNVIGQLVGRADAAGVSATKKRSNRLRSASCASPRK